MKQERWLVFSEIVLAGLLFYPASGQASCVNPAGSGSCFTSVQAAVDAAAPGERIDIAQGTYFETVSILAGKDGISLRGTGRVILDPDASNSGACVTIMANGVTIENVTIRNGTGDGIAIDDDATGTHIIKVQIRGPSRNCILADGDNTLVEQSFLLGCGVQGIDANADNVTIRRSTVLLCGSGCIDVNGDNTVVKENDVGVSSGGNAGDCIEVLGDNSTVEKNTVSNCDGHGIDVSSDNMRVLQNVVSATRLDAYDLDCLLCTGGLVSGNTAFDIPGDSGGFDISADAPGLLIDRNTAIHVADEGFLVSGTGIVLRDNEATENGEDTTESGFEVSGTGHTFDRNTADRNHGDGFNIDGDGHLFTNNVALGNVEDGIDVESGAIGVLLSKNTAMDNNAVGVEVSAGSAGTTVMANKAVDNRTDFCDEGMGTVGGPAENDFDTVGPCVID